MRRTLLLLASFGSLLLAGPATAGDGPCSAGLDVCLTEMGKQLKARGWVGIELDHEEGGTLKITRVVPGSPAEAAGLRSGDRLLALNGISYASGDRAALKRAYQAMVPDSTITYTVDRGGEELEVDVALVRLPDHVRAQWIAQHLAEGHAQPPPGS